ncbi:MAG: phosphotransferase [Planctomycetaceae bacterium]
MSRTTPPFTVSLPAEAGLPKVIDEAPMTGGGNNRLSRLTLADGRRVVAKSFFRDRSESRDRMESETSFLRFCKNNGVACVPALIASDRAAGVAILEDLSGQRPVRVDEGLLESAIDFVTAVNRFRNTPEARSLPPASDACFSLKENLDSVRRRLQRLQTMAADSNVNRDAVEFVAGPLGDVWSRVEAAALQVAARDGIDPATSLDDNEQCLSPSDFGFHNCLVTEDGHVSFVDFEYAGWDDPAKMIADFFGQPEVPVPMEYYSQFATRVLTGLKLRESERHRRRCDLLLPIHQVKWSCIMLNDFLPEVGRRREFAGAPAAGAKVEQLARARASLRQIAVPGESRA